MSEPAPSKPRWVRSVLRWGTVVLVFVFLSQRVDADWPAVSRVLSKTNWFWIAVSVIPGAAYFWLRAAAWRRLLATLGVRSDLRTVWGIWMKGEVVRYIPGYIWSVFGRMTQAGRIGTTRTTVFTSMVLEALVLVASAAGLAALLLIGYPNFSFSGRTAVLVLVTIASLSFAVRAWTSWLVRAIHRLLRRPAPVIAAGPGPAFATMAMSWLMFAIFQVLIAQALGLVGNGEVISLAGVFVVSWLLGYLSFVAPSGLGVREAFLISLLGPFMVEPEAVAVAAVSRVAMILIELAVLLIVVGGRRRAVANEPR